MPTGSSHHGSITAPPSGLIARMAEHLRHWLCGMHGHDSLLHFEHGRMSLLCASCGYESPGWELRGNPRVRVAQPRQRIVRLPLVGERRVA